MSTRQSFDEMRQSAKTTNHDDTLPLNRFLTYRMSRVQTRLNMQASRLLRREAGLSLTQWRIIALIGSRGSACAHELIRETAIDKGLFSRRLKTLIQGGLVETRQALSDHRAQTLTLSPAGARIYENTLPHMRARQAQLQAAFTAEERALLDRALDKLEAAADMDR